MSLPQSLPQAPRAKQSYQEYEEFPNNPRKTAKANAEADRLDPNALRRYSTSPLSHDGRVTPRSRFRGLSPAPYSRSPPLGGWFTKIKHFLLSQWQNNGGPLLIIAAQLFGALMNLSTRLLELEDGLHPMQILFARMASTIVCCFGYMWCRHVPAAPWGPREVRWLLCLRACAGFTGLYSMWYSIMYLPLAEATVISFLAPNVAGYLCRIFLKEPFTRREQIASYLALGGVVLITRPISLFSTAPDSPVVAGMTNSTTAAIMNGTVVDPGQKGIDYVPTAAERLNGIGMGLLGVVGGALTITVLRSIGTRAHPLISVNYFSMFCTLITIVTLSLAPVLDYDQPTLRFVLPSSLRQWGLLTVVGLCGFSTQFLLTAGLAREKSNRATGMIYTHVLFAAAFDRFVFGHNMGWISVVGCGMVVGSALWVAIGKGESEGQSKCRMADLEARGMAGTGATAGGEDIPMLASASDEDEDEGEGPLEMETLFARADAVETETLR